MEGEHANAASSSTHSWNDEESLIGFDVPAEAPLLGTSSAKAALIDELGPDANSFEAS